jgi:hypothetical protein
MQVVFWRRGEGLNSTWPPQSVLETVKLGIAQRMHLPGHAVVLAQAAHVALGFGLRGLLCVAGGGA